MFIGRENELKVLEEIYQRESFEFLIMYGRRRIGKTYLLSEFFKRYEGVFFLSEEKNDSSNRNAFCKHIYEFFQVSKRMPLLDSWNDIFSFIGEQKFEQRFLLIIDEFPYIAQGNKSLMSKIQHAIDHDWKDKNIFLILCGSSVSFMENEVMGASSPLFGRRTSHLQLLPLDYIDSAQFYPSYSYEERIIMYGVFGGIPQYLSLLDQSISIEDNVCRYILSSNSYLFQEPEMLLKSELREPSVYNSIIEVIAKGATKLSDIASNVYEDNAKCAKYIQVLIQLGILNKSTPIGAKTNSRNTIYQIADPFFRFWYRFLFGSFDALALMDTNVFFNKKVEPQLSTYMGLAFEKVCIEYMKRCARLGKLPFQAEKIGRWWGNSPIKKCEEDVDILVLGQNQAIFCECKWRNVIFDFAEYEDLQCASALFHEIEEKYYYLFSKSGFSTSLQEEARKNPKLVLISLENLFSLS